MYILGKSRKEDDLGEFPHHGNIDLSYPNNDHYLVAVPPAKRLVYHSHDQWQSSVDSKPYYIQFPWTLFVVCILSSNIPDNHDKIQKVPYKGKIITMNFAKESLLESLNTKIYYSYLPNAFYGHLSNNGSDLPDGVSILCGVYATLNAKLNKEDQIATTINAVWASTFRTSFDPDYHDNPMYSKHVKLEAEYTPVDINDEDYYDYEYGQSCAEDPKGLFKALENMSLEDLEKEDWGPFSNPLSFFVDYFQIDLNPEFNFNTQLEGVSNG